MRIDGPNRLSSAQAGDADATALRRPQAQQAARNDADAVVASPQQQHYVQQAAACDEIDLQAVAEARRLIEAGELDTPAAIERAAERILTQGL